MSAEGDDDAWLYGEEDDKEGMEPPGDAEPGDGAGVGPAGDGPPVKENGESHTDQPQEDGVVPPPDLDLGEEMKEVGDEENMPPPSIEGDEDDDSDDDIEITIDKDKIEAAKTSYQNMQLKKASQEFAKEKKGKFSVEEFDQIGLINGESAVEFDINSLEETPWRKPGADITDYFNYGFTEDTWTAYCNRQKTLRANEAGVPVLHTAPILTSNKVPSLTSQQTGLRDIPILGGGEFAAAAAAKQVPRIVSTLKTVEAKPPEPSGITVMTHDKRIYSNKIGNALDFSVPPPMGGFSMPPPGMALEPPPVIPTTAPPTEEFSASEFPASEFPPAEAFGEDPYSGGFNEPTAEAQWNVPPPVYNTSLPPPGLPPPIVGGPPPSSADPYGRSSTEADSRYRMRDSREREREDRYRDYDRDRRRRRSRSRDRDSRDRRDRDRYADRDRTRIKRERRSRSRSRSPRSKRSRSDRDRKRDSTERDRGEVKIKEEPEDSAPVAPPGEN